MTEDVGRSHRTHTGRGEWLEGQGDAVEASSQAGDDRRIARIELERLARARCALDEQPNRVGRGDLVEGLANGERKRWDRQQTLSRDGEPLTTRREHMHMRTGRIDRFDELGDCSDEVLTVVEHQEQVPVTQVLEQRTELLAPRVAVRPSAEAAASSTSFVFAGAAQRHDPDTVREPGSDSAAACKAKRVLPTPPTPVNVTSRDSRNTSATCASAVVPDEDVRLGREVVR